MKKKVIKGLLLLAIGMATMFQQILMPAGASAAYQEMPFITTNLGFPWKIAVEDDGNILVADAVYSTVYRFNSDGSNIINPVYKDIYSFKYPVVALDENEDIVIGDVYDNKISRISAQSGDIFDIIQIPNEYSLSAVYANVYGIYAVGNYLGLYHVDGHGAVAQKLDAIDLGITEAQDIVGKADGTLYISGFVRDVYYYDALNGIYYYDYVGRIVKVTLAGGVYTPSIIYSIRDAVIYGIGADNNDGIYFTETNISISNPYYQVVKRINRDGTVDVVLQSDGLTLPLDVGFTTIGETEKMLVVHSFGSEPSMVTKADVPVKGPSVSITNNFYPAMDTISVQDLAVGDVVYVYDSIGETLPMASAIVANTSTPTTIETDQLGNPPGKVYVSFMRGGAESGRREASYSGALMPVSYKVGNGGSISIIEGMNQTLMPGDVVQTVLYGEDPPYIMAVAKAGYRFVRWSDGLMDPDRWDRNVVNAIDVTALFESIPEIYADPVVTDNSKPAEALINGKVENIGKINITKEGNIDVTVITLDPDKFFTQLEAGGNKPIITIKVPTGTEAVEGMINGQIIKSMEMKDAVLELKTDQFAYSLPAAQINIDDILTNIGTEVQPKDITVKISIREADESTAKLMQDIAVAKNYQIVVKPVNFNVVCSSGDKTIEVTKFNGYVERIIAIPEEVDPSKITTGIVLNSDGTFSHIPTSFFNVDGKYYAKINSLTNSTYSVIYRPKTFKDVETHWAKDAVNDMGSRLVIDGIDENNFSPDRDITRAEFAAIMVRVLGLKGGRGDKSFYDVKAADWFSGYVKTAVEYGLIKGYDDGTFKPDAQITREEAMTVIARAMMWTGLKTEFGVDELTTLYTVMNDTDNVAVWAKGAVGACLKNGIVTGRDGLTIAPKASVTRAEVAVMVQRLLKKSKLIN